MSIAIPRVWALWFWLACVSPAVVYADAIDDSLKNSQRPEEDLDRLQAELPGRLSLAPADPDVLELRAELEARRQKR